MDKVLHTNTEELKRLGAIHTALEIYNQPHLWRETYEILLKNYDGLKSFLKRAYSQNNLRILLSGAGSSAFIGDVLEGIFQKYMGKCINAIPTTELVTHPNYYLGQEGTTLLISFARSGNSPESIKAIELAEQFCKNVYHLIITCNSEGQLAQNNNSKENRYILLMPEEANDKALAMTGSFTSMLLSGILIARLDELKALKNEIEILIQSASHLLNKYTDILKEASEFNFKRAVFLGSGFLKGIAKESHLKLQELTDGKIICKHDTFLGFRHGPKAVINEETLVVFLFSNVDYVLKYEKDLVQSVNQGRKSLCSIGIMENDIDDAEVDIKIKLAVDDNKIDETLLSVLSVLPAQILGFFKSLNLGLKPDNPSESGMITRVVQGVKVYPYEE